MSLIKRVKGLIDVDSLKINNLYSGASINNLGIDIDGNIIFGTTGDTNYNYYVTGGTYDSNLDIIYLERNDGINIEISGITDTFTTGGTYDNNTALITFERNDGTNYSVNLSSLDLNDTFITAQTFDNSTYILSSERNDGITINTDLSILASDIYVVSGVYDIITGIVTYTNSSGGTFQVSGFTTGMTDSYTTAANLNGEVIEFDNNIQGSNLYNVNLSPVLSGKTNLTLFNTHTGDTNNPHQTSLHNLLNTAHTHTLSEITDFNSYSGSVENRINEYLPLSGGTMSGTINFGSTNVNIKNNSDSLFLSATDDSFWDVGNGRFSIDTTSNIYLREDKTDSNSRNLSISPFGDISWLISGGTIGNTLSLQYTTDSRNWNLPDNSGTIALTSDLVNSYVTGFTYDGLNTFTISRNNGLPDLTSTISVLSGITYYGDGSQLSGISTDNFYITGGSYNSLTDTLSLNRNDAITINITGITDTFTTGGTYDNNTAILTFTKNDTTTYDVDMSSLPLTDEVTIEVDFNNEIRLKDFVGSPTGGTRTFDGEIAITSGLTLNILGTGTSINNLGIDVNGNIVEGKDFYVTGGTFSSQTLTLDRNDGNNIVVSGFDSLLSLNNSEIFVGNSGNTAQSVPMTGDVNIDNTGITTIQPNSVTYSKMQEVTQKAVLGSDITSGGTVTEIPIVDQFLNSGLATSLLSDTNNWDINGNYTGSTITNTFQGQMYYDGNYFFIAINDDIWVRLIRG